MSASCLTGSMDMPRYWHPNMMWYTQAALAACAVCMAFSAAIKPRFCMPSQTSAARTAYCGYGSRVAEVCYVASTGLPSVRGTFLGDYLGDKATGKPIIMRVMDWWRNDHALLTENWVLIDLLARLRE